MKDLAIYERIPPIENNFTVKFNMFAKDTALLPHWHEHLELLYFTKGECRFLCDGRQFTAKKGNLVIVNSTQVHSFMTDSRLEYICILVYPTFFSDIKFEGVRLKNLIPADPYIEECIDSIYAEHSEKRDGYDMMLKSHTYRMLAHLVRNYKDTGVSPRDFESHAVRLRRLNRVIEYIADSYAERITTKTLADMCYLSEAHFCRFFKGTMGKSAVEYINEYRIEKASVLLTNTDESIALISSNVGFDDLNYFSRIFKRIKGVPPGKYRRDTSSKSAQ